jgi:hypothetical protein
MKNIQHLYKPSKWDFILGGILLLLSAGSLLSVQKSGSDSTKQARIYRQNRLIRQIQLSREETIELDGASIEVKEGRIRITESDCPHKICEHTGWISHPAQTIVCVPNKLLVEIVGVQSEKTYNAVSY